MQKSQHPDEPRDWWDQEFRWLFTFGESITAGGWTSSRERSWPFVLAGLINDFQRFPVQLVNMGVGANVVSPVSGGYAFSSKPSALERVEKHILRHAPNGAPVVPDLLVISYGLNDARSGTPLDVFCREMEALIARVRLEIQPLIVLVGPYFMTDFQLGGREWSHANPGVLETYNEGIEALAARVDALYVDILSAYRGCARLVHRDGVHSNDLGHRIVANRIFEVLAASCSGLSLETKEGERQIPPWRDESTLEG